MIHRLKVCLNGTRRPEDHPALPLSPPELAAAAADAIAAGAEAVHLHPRGADGRESLRAADIAATVTAVRGVCSVHIGVSTGLWITSNSVEDRYAQVAEWAGLAPVERPDFASVNLSEPGYRGLIDLLHRTGIAVEVGVWSPADADRLATVDGYGRILVEVIGEPAERAVSAADAILTRLDALAIGGPRLLHGEQATCWPLVRHAGRLGLPTRIGLEDTLTGPDGAAALDNAALVRQALAVWSAP